LDHAEGVVPTRVGDVAVRLERDGDGFLARVTAPEGVPTSLIPAPGLKAASAAKTQGGKLERRFVQAG